MFLALALACAASRIGYVAPWAASVALLAVAWRTGAAERRPLSWLAAGAMAYAALVAINTLLLSPAYTPAGLYHPMFLALAFLAARGSSDRTESSGGVAILALATILAGWGLLQVGPLGAARAHAWFETPATLAAALNLILLPLLVVAMSGRRPALLLLAAAVLAAAVFAAASRGGFVALAAGLALAVILLWRARLLSRGGIGLMLALLAAGWIVATAARHLPLQQAEPRRESLPTAQMLSDSSVARLELSALAQDAWLTRPLAGTGYLTFRYVQEQGRAQAPSFGTDQITWFVHNDYLQALQELGPAGLAALLLLALAPPVLAYRRIAGLPESARLPVAASASALAAMAVHAVVDFPFYVPACLLLYGLLLGALDRRLTPLQPIARPSPRPAWHRGTRAAAITLAAIVLVRPLAAEAAAEWGLRRLAQGESERAAFWLGAARRIDSADWRYHWYAGRFWESQAAQSGRREPARLAADAYAEGFDANPLEVKNLLGKLAVHRRHRELLDAPADPATLRAWLAQAATLAPHDPDVGRARRLLETQR